MKFLHNIILGNLKEVEMIIEEGIVVNFKFDMNLISNYFRYLENQPNRFERKLVRLRYLIDDLDSPLHLAVALGNEYLCRKFLDKGADINARNWEGITPLQKAIKTHNFQIFRYLIIAGADFKIPDHWGRTPLMNVSEICDANFLKNLLKLKLDLEASCQNQLTAIFYSIQSKKFMNFKLLLEAGADIGRKDISDRTLLHHACLFEFREVASFLIKSGADVNKKCILGDAPLAMTVENKSDEIAKLLIQAGASINATNEDNETALHKASCALNPVIIHTLLDAGADANIKNKYRKLSLNIPALEIIIDHKTSGGAPIVSAERAINGFGNEIREIRSNDNLLIDGIISNLSLGDFPLHVAASMGREDVCKLLVENGAEINTRNEMNMTPLYKAVRYQHLNIFRFLIKSGADYNAVTIFGETILMCASRKYNSNFIKDLLKLNVELEVRDWLGETALFYSIKASFTNFKILYYAGADIIMKNKEGDSVLHKACLNQNRKIAAFLIKVGANVNEKTNEGVSVLKYSFLKSDSNELTKLLIKSGAIIDAGYRYGATALHIAARYLKSNILQTLLEGEAEINLENKNGKTAFDIVIIECINSSKSYFDKMDSLKLILKYSEYIDLNNILINHPNDINISTQQLICLIIKNSILLDPKTSLSSDIQMSTEMSDWVNNCKNQVLKMQSHFIGKTNTTLYSFIMEKNLNKVAGFLSNDSTGSRQELELNMPLFAALYPSYHGILEERFMEGIEKAMLLAKCFTVAKELDFKKAKEFVLFNVVKQLHCWNLESYTVDKPN
ncbi:hypothetical protein LAZ67_9003713 [Cordylochernes scorpioides]|uniref:Ankyrin repeat protein n=1 Tax=Cordylochernes scorpioides TaxID=51811 RepID=A0ABY6KWB3_9ARAC|nr:hypothetical protein LAZ67_9003713 [Cordylochernes scorpioides]